MKKNKFLLFALFLIVFSACSDDYVERDFTNAVSEEQLAAIANSSPEAALSIAAGVEGGNNFFLNDFNTAGNGNIHDDFGHMAVNLGTDLMSNDMVQVLSHWFVNYYNYTARNENSIRTDMVWKFYYKVIYNMNDALKLVPSTVIAPELKHIRGRLLAVRGYAYFQLIRIYGNGDLGIPIYTTTEALGERQPTADVKALILADFEEAYSLLEGYSRDAKTAVDKNVAAGFLARYHLEYGNYSQAATYAQAARSGYSPMSSSDLADGFNKIGNAEWMWGADINTATSTVYASFFSQIGSLNPGYAGLLNVYKSADRRIFDNISATDARKDWFVDAGNPYGLPKYANIKFIDDTDFEGDYVFMRAAEMYLIEAEAKALGGDEAGAKQVLLQLISTRDSGYALSSNTGAALLSEIRFHRKLELWGEGFAYFDMKRWNVELNRNYTGTNHASYGLFNYPAGSPKFVFQIPISEVNANISLGVQNPFE
ncbi:MAG TPA: RagB/SusD family nutrient uptake outer membrane protein [Flavobacterium sp.]|nr:RagB/SusD family nutrient uptake outer membrane protein [Flavobacterium sp.]